MGLTLSKEICYSLRPKISVTALIWNGESTPFKLNFGAVCPPCKYGMSRRLAYAALPVMNQSAVAAATKGFVKDVVTDMVTDDLVVKPMSTISSIALLNKFNVKDVSAVNFGMEEALSRKQFLQVFS
ncbi:putative 60S ribosomal protein L34-like [Capsicum annuum]|nr:putative 60S ribosomal protein L34-like [Capsicum annuum]